MTGDLLDALRDAGQIEEPQIAGSIVAAALRIDLRAVDPLHRVSLAVATGSDAQASVAPRGGESRPAS